MRNLEEAQQATLHYHVQRELARDCALLEVKLETGRKHQIRVQFSAIGHPIIGDRKYKSNNLEFKPGIALHSHRLVFEHPVKKEEIRIEVESPDSWKRWLS